MIYSPVEVVTASNVVDVLNRALMYHSSNQADIEYLYKYYRGNQPILNRIKEIRPEICNKIVENHAYEIVSFKTGYEFGEPIQYVRRGKDESTSDKINQLNEYMFSEDKASKDKELAEWFFICGTAYRMVLPYENPIEGESPVEIDTLDPRYSFVIYNSGFGKHPIAGVKFIVDEFNKTTYTVYTPYEYFDIVGGQITKSEAHSMGYVPIIEYPANSSRLGAFETVLPLLDELNNITSNRMDGVEQFVQAFMKFLNCDIKDEDLAALREKGAISLHGEPGNPADMDIVTKELNQTQVQVLVDYVYLTILKTCGVPTQSDNGSSSNTGTGANITYGWRAADSRANDTEVVFKKSERQLLRLVLRMSRDLGGVDLNPSEIDIKFNRRHNDNLLVKAQGLQNMMEAGVHPQIAIATSDLFADPTDVYITSLPYLKKWEFKEAVVTPSNNKPNPDPSGGGAI